MQLARLSAGSVLLAKGELMTHAYMQLDTGIFIPPAEGVCFVAFRLRRSDVDTVLQLTHLSAVVSRTLAARADIHPSIK